MLWCIAPACFAPDSIASVPRAEEMTKLCRKDGPDAELLLGLPRFASAACGRCLAERLDGGNLTSRVAYAGGTKVGEGGLVCYHNMEGKAGDAEELKSQSSVVSRVQADYGQLGHAEVVEMTLSLGPIVSSQFLDCMSCES